MRFKQWMFFCAGLLFLALTFSYPLIHHLHEGMPYSFIPVEGSELVQQHPGDYLQLFYRFWLFRQALSGRMPFFSNDYEFSTPLTPPRFNTQGIPLSFITALFTPMGNIVAYNALVILSFLASGFALALLVRKITKSRGAALCCGALYACFPYRLGHLFGGHPGGFVLFLVPLALYCLEKSWPTETSRMPGESMSDSCSRAFLWGLACGLCILCSALTELHITFYLCVLLPMYILTKFLQASATDGMTAAWRNARLPLLGLALTTLAALAYVLWVRHSFLEASTLRGGRILGAVQAFNPALANIFRISPSAEKNIYLGLVPLVGAIYGFFVRRAEINKRLAEKGALLWLYFWTCLFLLCYLIALGTAPERYLPLYSWLHAHVPFLRYSRTPNRLLTIAALGFFMLCAYGVRHLLSKGWAASCAAWILLLIALADYHPRSAIGISVMRGMDQVYQEVRGACEGTRLLELPIWPGDDTWSSIYEYYVTLTGVPTVNGYSPAPQRSYIRGVFLPLRNLNLGEMRPLQHTLLKEWHVPCIVLHQEAFPRKVSRYPFRFTLLNLLGSPYLEFVRQDGPHYLFKLRGQPAGPEQAFSLKSPVGILYPAHKMEGDVGGCISDRMSPSGLPRCASSLSGGGCLLRGQPRTYPTGEFRVLFYLKSISPEGREPVGRIEVCAPDEKKVVSARELVPGDFKSSDAYEMFELGFKNEEPARIEFRVHSRGNGSLRADFIYVVFKGEEDPGRSYEAEDLFHIGDCVNEGAASGGNAVAIGKNEDPSMPMVSGPTRLYGPGRYRARYYLKAEEMEPGAIARLEVASGFGGVLASRAVAREELAARGRYTPCDVAFEIKKLTPLSFYLWHFNKALLRLDKIEVE